MRTIERLAPAMRSFRTFAPANVSGEETKQGLNPMRWKAP